MSDTGRCRRPWATHAPGTRRTTDTPDRRIGGSADQFHERYYNEFVTFVPYVQQFLYGEGRAAQDHGSRTSGSPMRLFRRNDLRKARMVLRPGEKPLLLGIVHVDLYFFLDVALELLNVEVSTDQLPLTQAQELIYRFGRGYPAGWQANGQAMHRLAMFWRNGADRHR